MFEYTENILWLKCCTLLCYVLGYLLGGGMNQYLKKMMICSSDEIEMNYIHIFLNIILNWLLKLTYNGAA